MLSAAQAHRTSNSLVLCDTGALASLTASNQTRIMRVAFQNVSFQNTLLRRFPARWLVKHELTGREIRVDTLAVEFRGDLC